MNDTLLLACYFVIYSFIGWGIESAYKSILDKKVINSGFLHGPICPIYGFGALIMYLSLKDVTNNIFILFIFGIIVLSLFEYVVGLFLEVVFKTKYWDYSNKKYNIQGRVCLQNSIYWGILGIVFMKGIHPLVELILALIPDLYITIFTIAIISAILVDATITIIGLVKINIKLRDWREITENIRKQVEAINIPKTIDLSKIKGLNPKHGYKFIKKVSETPTRDELLLELKAKQQELQEKLEHRLARLKKAFPTMNSEVLSKFLNNMKKS